MWVAFSVHKEISNRFLDVCGRTGDTLVVVLENGTMSSLFIMLWTLVVGRTNRSYSDGLPERFRNNVFRFRMVIEYSD